MCGIAGVMNADKNKVVDAQMLVNMAAIQHHRGPDGFGYQVLNQSGVGFSHARLSIIDLNEQRAKQPFLSKDQNILLAHNVFGKIFTNLVRAGEQSGEISKVFEELGASLKFQDEQAAMTKKLLTYPAFVGTVVGGVVFFLMTYLVPELLRFVKTMGQELPIHTKALIVVSNIFVNYWYILLLIPVIIFFCVYIAIKVSPSFHLKYDQYKLKIPVIGPILEKIILTRLCSFFAIMYSSGITIIDCIRTGEEIAGNKYIAQSMREVGQQISDGTTLSDSFERSQMFPPLVLRMIRVGESTGALETALSNISYFYTRDVKESIERLQSMIEPAMTIILGSIIAWVMFSVLGPIYDLITKVKI